MNNMTAKTPEESQKFKVGQCVWSISTGITGYILRVEEHGCRVILCGQHDPSLEDFDDLEIINEDYVTK